MLTHTSGLAANPGYYGEANPDHVGFWKALDGKDWLSHIAKTPPAMAVACQGLVTGVWSIGVFGLHRVAMRRFLAAGG